MNFSLAGLQNEAQQDPRMWMNTTEILEKGNWLKNVEAN